MIPICESIAENMHFVKWYTDKRRKISPALRKRAEKLLARLVAIADEVTEFYDSTCE